MVRGGLYPMPVKTTRSAGGPAVNCASPFTSCGPYHGTPPGEESVSSGVVSKLEELRNKILEDYKQLPFVKSCGQTPPAWNLWDGYHTTQGGSGSLHCQSVLYASGARRGLQESGAGLAGSGIH